MLLNTGGWLLHLSAFALLFPFSLALFTWQTKSAENETIIVYRINVLTMIFDHMASREEVSAIA